MSRQGLANFPLAKVELEFHHRHRLLDPSARGVQRWEVSVLVDGQRVGLLHAVRGLFWKADDLRERLGDEQSFCGVVAEQVLDSAGRFSSAFEDFTEAASSLLVIERLDLQEQEPYADPLLVAAVVAAVVDRLTENHFAVVLPTADVPVAGAALLAEAGRLLAAEPFSEELQIMDTSLAAPEEAANRVRGLLQSLARSGGGEGEGGESDWEDEDGGEDAEDVSVRTAAVLRLALEELSAQTWEDVAEFGDRPVGRGQGAGAGAGIPAPGDLGTGQAVAAADGTLFRRPGRRPRPWGPERCPGVHRGGDGSAPGHRPGPFDGPQPAGAGGAGRGGTARGPR
ncbi:hypothetical protein [Streptomyces violaceoruber]|uniref:hypothetical protein n=1 Tax=Streptomyces violaceoruber TaxID=1935 RepID=UPI003B434274